MYCDASTQLNMSSLLGFLQELVFQSRKQLITCQIKPRTKSAKGETLHPEVRDVEPWVAESKSHQRISGGYPLMSLPLFGNAQWDIWECAWWLLLSLYFPKTLDERWLISAVEERRTPGYPPHGFPNFGLRDFIQSFYKLFIHPFLQVILFIHSVYITIHQISLFFGSVAFFISVCWSVVSPSSLGALVICLFSFFNLVFSNFIQYLYHFLGNWVVWLLISCGIYLIAQINLWFYVFTILAVDKQHNHVIDVLHYYWKFNFPVTLSVGCSVSSSVGLSVIIS